MGFKINNIIKMAIFRNTDFENSALRDWGVSVTRTPIITTFTGNGDEIMTDGTSETITAILHKKKPDYSQNEEGLLNKTIGYIMVKPTQALNRNDKITYNGEVYRVLNPITRGPAGDSSIYIYSDLELIS